MPALVVEPDLGRARALRSRYAHDLGSILLKTLGTLPTELHSQVLHMVFKTYFYFLGVCVGVYMSAGACKESWSL